MSKNNTNNNEIKHHLLRRLVNVVVGSEEELASSAITFFVEQTLLEVGNNKSQNEIIKEIKRVFLLNFSSEEIVDALNRLVKEKKVVLSANRYSLEINRSTELKDKNTKADQFEKQIFNDWLNLISIKYPKLSDDDKKRLVSDLQLYLNKIFLQHGAECVILIYPQEEKLDSLIKNYSVEELNKIVPERSAELSEIRNTEFPLFLKNIDNQKKIYFAGMLDGTFVYNLLQVDPMTQQLIRENFKNYRLYLDTNVLYSLFDLQDKRKTSIVEKAVKLATDFGMKVVVSEETVEEMKRSINLKKELLLNSPDIKQELAEIGADISDEENFITAYWRAFHKTGISKEDFIEKNSHVAEILKAKNILIEKGPVFSISELNKETDLLKSASQRKTENTARHDAYHKLLIDELRKVADQEQKPDKYWFLSLDSYLLVYDRQTRDKGKTPFVLLPHQLLQILRPFGRRTEDYDAVFFELFSRPQIKSVQGVLPTDLTQKVLAKMSGFGDLPADIALSIIIDQSFKKKVIGAKDEATLDTVIKEETESRITKELNEQRKRIEELELENQKRSRLSEAEKTKGQNDNATKNKQLELYKTIAFLTSATLFIIAIILAYTYLWQSFGKLYKAIFILIGIGVAILIVRIKWKQNKAVNAVLAIIGVISFVLDVL